MKSKNAAVSRKHVYEWARYEMSLLKLEMPEKEVRKSFREFSAKSLSIMEAHYMINNCFLPEGYILRNAHKLSRIPVNIVHGRYDVICPPIQAWLLHKALPRSRLSFTISGHGSTDGNMQEKLVEEMRKAER